MKPLFFGECDRLDDGGFAIGEHAGTRLQLGDVAVQLGFWLRYVRGLLHSSGRRFGVGSHQETNRVWLVRDDGTKVELGKRNGVGLAIHEVSAGVEVAYMPTGTTWRAETFTLDLDFLHSRSGTTSNTSQGLIDFGPDGVPIVATDPLDRPIGGSLYNVRWLVRRGDVEFGKALGPLPDGLLMAAGGQVGTLSHGKVFEVFNISPNGFFWCGQHLDSETVVYGDVPAIVPPLVTKPIAVPAFVQSSYAIGVGMFDDMDGPRLIDATEVPSGNVRAVFHHVGSGSVPASMAVAKSIGWPCLFWWDKHGADPTDVPPRGRALLYAYPKLGRPISETVAKFQADVARMKQAGVPCDVGMALYRQWNENGFTLDEQHVLDCAAAIWKAAIQAKCGAVWIFSKHRGQFDGVDAIQSFQTALGRMRGASPDWRTFPKFADTPAPHPEPEPQPEPKPDSAFFPQMEVLF